MQTEMLVSFSSNQLAALATSAALQTFRYIILTSLDGKQNLLVDFMGNVREVTQSINASFVDASERPRFESFYDLKTLKTRLERSGGTALRALFKNVNPHPPFCWALHQLRLIVDGDQTYRLATIIDIDDAELDRVLHSVRSTYLPFKVSSLMLVPGSMAFEYDPATDSLTVYRYTADAQVIHREYSQFLLLISCGIENGIIDPESYGVVDNHISHALESGATGEANVFRARFFGKEYRWYRTIALTDRDSTGRVSRMFGRIEDINNEMERIDELSDEARVDSMTKLLTHEDTLRTIRDKRTHTGGTLLFIDVDDFKCVNDHFGHQVGDDVIVGVADALRKTFRSGDPMGRYGGDEFIVYMSGCTLRNVAIERIKRLVELLSSHDQIKPKVTVSIGVAIDDDTSEPLETLIDHADRALYRAKNEGKNRFVIAD